MSTSKKFLITLLALSAIAIAAVGASFSSFTASPLSIQSQAFADGALSIGADRTSAIFSIHDAIIGSEATGSVTIQDTGSIPAAFTMTGSVDSGSASALAGTLMMTIYQDTDLAVPAIIYNGTVAAFTSLNLGTFQKSGTTGDRHTYFFHVLLPSSGTAADNLLQGMTVNSTFSWNAVQAA
jgi:spore coat-associated protein N